MKIKETTVTKLGQCRDLLRSVLKDESTNKARPDNEVDELRSYLFLSCLKDAAKGISKVDTLVHMTEEEITQMCTDEKITVQDAINNVQKSMMVEIIHDLMSSKD